METQRWAVYMESEEEKELLGSVVTSKDANVITAWQKANHKYNAGNGFTIGWNLIVVRI